MLKKVGQYVNLFRYNTRTLGTCEASRFDSKSDGPIQKF